MLDSLGISNHPPFQMQDLDYSVTNVPSSDIINLEDTLVDKQLTNNWKESIKDIPLPMQFVRVQKMQIDV